MCGILGTFGYKVSQGELEACLMKIKHRGPDDGGIWQDEVCSLGHRRLSILDLSEDGRQPMFSRDERYVIIFNGEIYNYIELRNELKKIGYIFKTRTDTEVALYAYLEWREKSLDKFNGMWALAIYDTVEKELFLARDRMGVKPLFLAQIDNGFIFGSEMKAIMPLLKKKTINYKLLMDKNRTYNYEATEECLVKEIGRLKAGHYAIINQEGIKTVRWWKTLQHLIEIPQNYNEQVEYFRELFMDACKIRMRSDVTLGTALSGGLDSSATICTMAQICRNKVDKDYNSDCQHAFIAAFPGTSLDESEYASKVTDYLGIDYTQINIDPVNGLKTMEQDIYTFEEVYSTSPIPMLQLYRGIKEHGVTVSLDGHGADELFCGYYSDIPYALLDAGLNINEVYDILDTQYASIGEKVEKGKCIRKYIDFLTRHCAKKVLHVPTWDRLMDEECKSDFYKMGHLERTLYNSTHMTILPTLMRNYDHYSMASGVEIRMPFLDYRIVQFAFSIPWKSKLQGGYTKRIVRDALKDWMPTEVAWRRSKIGFNTPMIEWVRGPWKEWILDTMNSSDFLNSDVVDARALKDKMFTVINGIGNSEELFELASHAWTELNQYLWKKYFFDSPYCRTIV